MENQQVLEKRVLLQNSFSLQRYDLELTPDLNRFSIDGRLKITLTITKATASIWLHSKEICLLSAAFTCTSSAEIVGAEKLHYDLKATTLQIVFGQLIPVGEGVLELTFLAQLNNEMAGFYRSTYTDINGAKKIMASTQFEALVGSPHPPHSLHSFFCITRRPILSSQNIAQDARRCFPCIDEPAAKAVFGATLIVPAHLGECRYYIPFHLT